MQGLAIKTTIFRKQDSVSGTEVYICNLYRLQSTVRKLLTHAESYKPYFV